MEEKGRGGKTALHVLAFIGVTLALLIIAALAALYIVTKGPSDAARDSFVGWSAEHGLGGVSTLFLSDQEEKDAMGGGDAIDDVQPESSDVPIIIVSEEAPDTSAAPEASAEPDTSAAPETSAEPAASQAPDGSGEEDAA